MFSRHWLTFLFCCAAASTPVWGQCAAPAWSSMNAVDGFDERVRALRRWDPDGPGALPALVIAGGYFGTVGSTAVSRIASWDGTAWSALGTGLVGTAYASVEALSEYAGLLIVAGAFSTAGGVPANNIAAWDGSSWQALGTGLDGGVEALAEWNGDLIVGGSFQNAGGIPAAGLARWNGTSWSALGTVTSGAAAGAVKALTVYNNDLIAGGWFSAVNGMPASHVARWNGISWSALGSGVTGGPGTARVEALEVFGGALVAGGSFQQAGGVTAPGVAAWNGSTWSAIGTGTGNIVYALRAWGTDLLAGGTFVLANGGGLSRGIARWNGSSWSPFGTGLAGGGLQVDDFLTDGAGFFAGGYFECVNGVFSSCLARWSGSAWQPQAPVALRGFVQTLLKSGSDLLAGGTFGVSDAVPSTSVARWNGSWQRMGTGLPLSGSGYPGNMGYVRDLAPFNGEIVAAGSFTLSAPPLVDGFARWDGINWLPIPAGPPGSTCLEPHAGSLVAGGQQVAAWNGTSWTTLGTGAVSGAASPGVFSLASSGTALFAAGRFLSIGGITASNVAVWNGAVWAPLGAGIAGVVNALAVYNGELIAAGGFTAPGSSIARWNGSAWLPLGSGIVGPVMALTVAGGELIAGGQIAAAGGITVSRLARWDGSTWSAMGAGAGNTVYALESFEGGVVAGGDFTNAGGLLSPSVARWSRPLPVFAPSQAGAGAPVFVTERGLVPGHECFGIVSLDLCPGGPGTGPVGGLCFSDPNVLLAQVLLPLGAAPFHFSATAPSMTFGPFALPAGLAFEALCLDATTGLACGIGPVTGFLVQ